jgi:hypothetical protein
MNRFKTFTEIFVAWVGLLALGVGAWFAVVQYLDKEKGDRVKYTLDFLDRQGRDPVSKARRSLVIAWGKHENELMALLKNPKATSTDLKVLVLDVVDREKIVPDVFTMVDFYDGLQICVAREVCDSRTAQALFRHDAKAFFNLHRPLFLKLRIERGDHSFAGPLQDFVR